MKACDLEINLETLKIITVESTETQDDRKIGSIYKVPCSLRKELKCERNEKLGNKMLEDKMLDSEILGNEKLINEMLGYEMVGGEKLESEILEETLESKTLKVEKETIFDSFEQQMMEVNIVEDWEFIYMDQKKGNPNIKCEINIMLENSKPFGCAPRRLSCSEKKALQKMLYEYIKDGITQAIRSVLVKKKSGDIRLCIDFRRLNKIMAKDKYPIPLIDNLLDKLVGKSVFTKLDLKKGYFHVFVNEDLVKYTSFTTPLGQFEFLRIPMGLKTSPQVFQRFVNKHMKVTLFKI